MSNSYFRLDGGIYMREGMGAEVSAPPAFGTLAPLNKSPTVALSSLTSPSTLSLPNPPFLAVYELLYTGYFD